MSEYWVSKKKYLCKYCDIFITDDAPSRQQHENGLKHKGNKERFIRDIYKRGERAKKDAAEEAREAKRLEKAAQEAYAADLASGSATASTSALPPPSAAPSPPPRAPPPQPLTKKRVPNFSDYTTAKDLGFDDPAAEAAAAERAQRASEGVAGKWTIVAPPPGAAAAGVGGGHVGGGQGEPEVGFGQALGVLRGEEGEEGRFKMGRKRVAPVGLGEVYVPGEIKVKKREATRLPVKAEEPAAPMPEITGSWAPIAFGQLRAGGGEGEGVKEEREEEEERRVFIVREGEGGVKKEEEEGEERKPDVAKLEEREKKEVVEEKPLFKKRKGAPAGARGGGKRRI